MVVAEKNNASASTSVNKVRHDARAVPPEEGEVQHLKSGYDHHPSSIVHSSRKYILTKALAVALYVI